MIRNKRIPTMKYISIHKKILFCFTLALLEMILQVIRIYKGRFEHMTSYLFIFFLKLPFCGPIFFLFKFFVWYRFVNNQVTKNCQNCVNRTLFGFKFFKTISDLALFTDITLHIWHKLDESEVQKGLASDFNSFLSISIGTY